MISATYCLSVVAVALQGSTPRYLVKEAGVVTYTARIFTGYKLLPPGHQLVLTTIPEVSWGSCSVGSVDIPLVAGAAAVPQLNSYVDVYCSFSVTANDTHKHAGEIAPFDVKAKFTGPNNTAGVYLIEGDSNNLVRTTLSVPVYTGGILGTPSSAVVVNDATTYITGETMLNMLYMVVLLFKLGLAAQLHWRLTAAAVHMSCMVDVCFCLQCLISCMWWRQTAG